MKELLIFGATSFAKLARHYAERELGYRALGFVVNESYKTADEFDSLPIFSWEHETQPFLNNDVSMFVAVGYRSMLLREKAYKSVKDAGYRLISIVCKSSYIADGAVIGDNSIVMPGAVIEPAVTLGCNNVVWSNATICHDTQILDHNFIAAHTALGGFVNVGCRNFFGFSSVVLQGRRIGNDTLVGAQSLVIRDTLDLSLYYGNPAKRIRELDSQIGVSVSDEYVGDVNR